MTRGKKARGAFTLVEVMIGSAIAAVVMSAMLSTYGFLGRNLARLSSYEALQTESRKTLTYLSRDFTLARAVKSGTSPTASAVTLVLPSGEVTYTYDSTARSLRRQATFGPSPDLTFLRNNSCGCTTFEFRYFTTRDEAPVDQTAPGTNVPFSIKQIQVRYVVESPAAWSALTRSRYETASARYFLQNRGAPDGT